MAVVAILFVTAGAVIGVRLAVRADGPEAPTTAEMPRSDRIEREYGIRIDRVSLLAEGGVVELRYVLLDADAASVLHSDDQDFQDDFPHIIAGDTVIDLPTFHHHGGDLVTGRQLSILYGNLDGAVVEGDIVSIEIGDERLDGVPVG
jgi:hypothetical protein